MSKIHKIETGIGNNQELNLIIVGNKMETQSNLV